MLAVLKHYPSGVNLLLASAFVLTLGRAITLPYLVLYLSSQYQLSIAAVGTTVGCALVAGSLLSLYGGYLTDRLKPYPLILGFTGCFIAAFIGMCLTSSLVLFFIALVLFNFAYAVIDITAKATFGRLLPRHEQSRVFSLRYTLINMAYAVGPFIGAALAGLSMSLPFILSAALGAGFFWLYVRYADRELGCEPAQTTPFSFVQVGKVLLNDRRLVCFTLGGILSAVVFGQFSAYLSQYLVVTSDPQRVYSVITTLLAVNACEVIPLGEIIVFPAEYMFIDRIAPTSLRGMYFAAQSLSNLGGALGPIVCGLVLAMWPAPAMFYVLAGFLIVGGGLYLLGGTLSNGSQSKF